MTGFASNTQTNFKPSTLGIQTAQLNQEIPESMNPRGNQTTKNAIHLQPLFKQKQNSNIGDTPTK